MSAKRPGRPAGGAAVAISRDDILDAGLAILRDEGHRGLTMRALSRALGVTPMALYHHVGARDELVGLLAKRVFEGIATPPGGDPAATIAALVTRYAERATAHSELVLTVFRTPSAMDGPLQEITEALRGALADTGLDRQGAEDWLALFVDYAHGFTLSGAADPGTEGEAEAWRSFGANLDRLLAMLKAETGGHDRRLP
ncbi:TetR family transcriptional regulator [Rhodobacterales bacterium HKCCE2091]|nr:TetR family transcriptional regulator [Rhodobacterales bacterium HKCCE2091]